MKDPIEKPNANLPPLKLQSDQKNKGGRPRKDGLPPGSVEAKTADTSPATPIAAKPAAPKAPSKIEKVYEHVQLTPEIIGKALGGLGLLGSALDTPIWRLDAEEMNELGELWFPIAKVYEADLKPYIGAMLLLPGTIAILAPRIKIRILMMDPSNGITQQNCRQVLNAIKGVAKDLVNGKEVKMDEQGNPVVDIPAPPAPVKPPEQPKPTDAIVPPTNAAA